MGIVADHAVFEGHAPTLEQIAAKVTELSGLAVQTQDSTAEIKGELYDLHGHLAFACAPHEQVEVYAYRLGAVKEMCADLLEGMEPLPFAQHIQGRNEPAGTQTVYLRGFLGQELSLLFITALALEALGGRSSHPIAAEERRQYGRPLTIEQLLERHGRRARQRRVSGVIFVLLLPVLVPLWILWFVWIFLAMPWRLWRAYRLFRHDRDGPR